MTEGSITVELRSADGLHQGRNNEVDFTKSHRYRIFILLMGNPLLTGDRGKTVKIRYGPAAVTGDESRITTVIH